MAADRPTAFWAAIRRLDKKRRRAMIVRDWRRRKFGLGESRLENDGNKIQSNFQKSLQHFLGMWLVGLAICLIWCLLPYKSRLDGLRCKCYFLYVELLLGNLDNALAGFRHQTDTLQDF